MGASRNDRCQRGLEPVIRDDGSIEIPLTKGATALVDSDDYDGLKSRRWSAVWNSRMQKWASKIRLNITTHHIGYFDDEEEAALAYDDAAKKLHREFAFTNEMAGLL